MRVRFPHWFLRCLPFPVAHHLGTHFGNGLAHNHDPETLENFRKIHAMPAPTLAQAHAAFAKRAQATIENPKP